MSRPSSSFQQLPLEILVRIAEFTAQVIAHTVKDLRGSYDARRALVPLLSLCGEGWQDALTRALWKKVIIKDFEELDVLANFSRRDRRLGFIHQLEFAEFNGDDFIPMENEDIDNLDVLISRLRNLKQLQLVIPDDVWLAVDYTLDSLENLTDLTLFLEYRNDESFLPTEIGEIPNNLTSFSYTPLSFSDQTLELIIGDEGRPGLKRLELDLGKKEIPELLAAMPLLPSLIELIIKGKDLSFLPLLPNHVKRLHLTSCPKPKILNAQLQLLIGKPIHITHLSIECSSVHDYTFISFLPNSIKVLSLNYIDTTLLAATLAKLKENEVQIETLEIHYSRYEESARAIRKANWGIICTECERLGLNVLRWDEAKIDGW